MGGNQMKTLGWLVMALGLVALQGCASNGGVQYAAGAQPPPPTRRAVSKAVPAVTGVHSRTDFAAVDAAIRQEMAPGGRFGSVTKGTRALVDGRLADMSALFDKYASVDQMDAGAVARLNDDQNAINAALAPNDGNRLICREETPVGTNIPKRVCRTLTQIRNQQNAAQHEVLRAQELNSTQRVSGH